MELTVAEVVKKKHAVERTIATLLTDFFDETGIPIERVGVSRIDHYTTHDGKKRRDCIITEVTIMLEI